MATPRYMRIRETRSTNFDGFQLWRLAVMRGACRQIVAVRENVEHTTVRISWSGMRGQMGKLYSIYAISLSFLNHIYRPYMEQHPCLYIGTSHLLYIVPASSSLMSTYKLMLVLQLFTLSLWPWTGPIRGPIFFTQFSLLLSVIHSL